MAAGAWYYLLLFYSERELGPAYTTMNIANCLSGIVGGPVAALLLSLGGLGGLRGWQWLFMLEGVPAVALGAAMAALLARDASTAAFLTPAERAWLVARCCAVACPCLPVVLFMEHPISRDTAWRHVSGHMS